MDWRIRRLCEQIVTRQMDLNATLRALSGQFGLTPSHIGRAFKRELGIGFREFLVIERMRYAQKLLTDTKLSVKQIAGEVGYRYPSDLNHNFKKQFGFSPRQYRQLQLARGLSKVSLCDETKKTVSRTPASTNTAG